MKDTNNATTETTTTEATEKAKKAPLVFENWEKNKAGVLNNINSLVDTVKKKTGTNVIAAVKNLETYANDCKGEPNLRKRISWLAAGLDIHPDEIVQSKAGVTALATMLGNIYSGNPAGEDVAVTKAVKESAISFTETMLASGNTFGTVEASEALKNLDENDINAFQSATHASFQSAMKLLSTKENPFPRQAEGWLSSLIGASGGSLDWFDCSDEFLVESSGMSLSTIKRGRAKLIDWMNATGKGIVAINQPAKKPTQYKVNLLAATTAIIANLIVSEHARPENLLVVAGLTGKLLTDGTDKVRGEVSDDVLQAAKELNSAITGAIDTLPKPSVKFREAAKASSADHTGKRFETFGENLGTAIEKANEAGLESVSKSLEKLSKLAKSARNKWEADNSAEVDWTSLDNQLSANLIQIKEAATSATEAAQAKVAEEKEVGDVRPETRRYLAEMHIQQFQTPEALSDEEESCKEAYAFNVYALAAIGDTYNDFAIRKELFLYLQNQLQAAFAFGPYAKSDEIAE